MTNQQTPPHDSNSTTGDVLELHVVEVDQLFNSMDPSPFRERDLDRNARDYIIEWARETRAGTQLGLVVRVSRGTATAQSSAMLESAVHGYFRERARVTRWSLRQLFRKGRISLVIGLAFLAFAIVFGEFVASLVPRQSYSGFIEESFVIGGWVALWRPLEIFLYDWWPIRAEARLFDRLGEMVVTVRTPMPVEGTA